MAASDFEDAFRALAAGLNEGLEPGEVLLLDFYGEQSDFVRFNHNRVREAGHLRQASVQLELSDGSRALSATLPLCGEEADLDAAKTLLQGLRERLPLLPEDPWLHFATETQNSLHRSPGELPDAGSASAELMAAAEGLDLVGSWASGAMHFGFANSLGQFNWHSDSSLLASWSIHGRGEAAVKQSLSGSRFVAEHLRAKLAEARETLALLERPPRRLSPGRYRVFLAPAALYELFQVAGADGFGMKSLRSAQSPLLRLQRGDLRLAAGLTLREDHAGGRTPRFTPAGFIKPPQLTLVREGRFEEALCGPRSAREYGATVNCAQERAQSLVMEGGELSQDEVLRALGTGIYIGNLWYCNLSDRGRCRITGLTRFACYWVEDGVPVAPIDVMRFDESLFHILGGGLEALTREHERIAEPGTYGRRSAAGARLPGALVDGFRLTL